MKAAVRTSYGPPEVVHVTDVPTPAPAAGEILVKVHATTVNRTDCAYRAGKPFFMQLVAGLPRPRVTVLGTEFAGEVAAVGRDVTSFAVGDRVFGYDESKMGAHAEHKTLPADACVATIPEGLSYDAVAAATEGAHYALAMIRGAKITAGQDVMVYGATGGIGSAAVQLLVGMDVTVTAVCSTAHVALVEGLGADRVVDYTAGDFTAGEQRYDVVIDAVGKTSFGRCRQVLRPHGIYLSSELGPYAQNPLLAMAAPLSRGRKVLFPIPRQDQQMVRYFGELMQKGTFAPVIDRRYPLDDIVEAYRYVESGTKVGNVVMTVT